MKAKEMIKRRMGIGSSGLHLQLLAQYTLTVRLREVLRDRSVVRMDRVPNKLSICRTPVSGKRKSYLVHDPYRLPRVRVKNIAPSHAPPAFFHAETLRERPPASPFLNVSKDQIPALLPVFIRFKIEPDEAVGRLGLQGEFRFRARHVALLCDTEANGSAVERVLAAAEPRNEFLARKEKSVSGEFWWIIGIMLTASLVAPFWYDAISGISSVAQRAHAARKAARE